MKNWTQVFTLPIPEFQKQPSKMFVKAGPNDNPIASPSKFLWHLLAVVKNDSLLIMLYKLQKLSLGTLGGSLLL